MSSSSVGMGRSMRTLCVPVISGHADVDREAAGEAEDIRNEGGDGAMSAIPVYPVHVRGSLDPQLSRWLWLVKLLLAVPHYVVLLFLWIAFCCLTVVAFFAIVFTGRYPRSLFDFNLGVLRWTRPVAFYSYSALGFRRMVQAVFLLEWTFVALTSIVLGTALPLVLSYNIIQDQQNQPSWANIT